MRGFAVFVGNLWGAIMPDHYDIEETVKADHLSIATEYIRQLQAERANFAEVVAEMFAKCYASSYLRGDEVASIIRGRYCKC